MLGKRIHSSNKASLFSRSSGKGKDLLSKTTSRFGKNQLDSNESNYNTNINFPYLKPSENTELLPYYYAVLSRSAEEGIGIKDLDQLQFELEKLLSASVVRSRILQSELEHADRVGFDDKPDTSKKGKIVDKPPSPKHRKIEEKIKHARETKAAFKLVKNLQEDVPKLEAPKLILPKNDTKSKFWLSVDAYCAPVTADDKTFLDELINEVNKDVNLKINDIGQHYSGEWSVESQINNKTNKTNPINGFTAKKNGFFNSESFTNSFLLPNSQDKMKEILMKPVNHGICLDKRLRSELVELGIIEIDDSQKTDNNTTLKDNDILQEIKLCQKELIKINETNVCELNRLRTAVNKDLARQEYARKMENVDSRIMEIYNKLLTVTPKEKSHLEWEAIRIIQTQKQLHKETMEITGIF